MRGRGTVIALTLVWRCRVVLLFLRRASGSIWRTVKAWWTRVSDWCERHAGLGAWAAVIVATAAPLGLLWVEYLRTQRMEDGRVNAEINLIRTYLKIV